MSRQSASSASTPSASAGSEPAGAREIALETTRRVTRGAFLSRELGRALDRASIDPRERSFATDLAYGAVRHRIWLDAALAPRLRDPDGLPDDVREALRLGAYEILVRGTPPHAAVNSWVEVTARRHPRLRGLVNAVLRKVRPPVDPSPATRASLPDWLWQRIATALGPHAEAATVAMREPAPLWLTALRPGAAEALRADGCEVAAGPIPGTLRVRPSRRLGDLSAFRDGSVQPQNPSSAWVAHAVGAPAGARVLDLCSGRGVKAALLAAAGAEVEAIELSGAKIDQARRNLDRLGLAVRHLRADLTAASNVLAPEAAWSEVSEPDARERVAPALHVLLDAPCSGTGTLRGHPEIALRASEASVREVTALQDALLDTAAALVAPGGTLVYAVCALTPDEGPDRIDAFLARHGRFVPESMSPPLPHHRAGAGVFLLPEDGLDGFFVARLRREAEASPDPAATA